MTSKYYIISLIVKWLHIDKRRYKMNFLNYQGG